MVSLKLLEFWSYQAVDEKMQEQLANDCVYKIAFECNVLNDGTYHGPFDCISCVPWIYRIQQFD